MTHEQAVLDMATELFLTIEPIRNYPERMYLSEAELTPKLDALDKMYDRGCKLLDKPAPWRTMILLDAALSEAFRVVTEGRRDIEQGSHRLELLWHYYRQDHGLDGT